jgi:hypothetical protein
MKSLTSPTFLAQRTMVSSPFQSYIFLRPVAFSDINFSGLEVFLKTAFLAYRYGLEFLPKKLFYMKSLTYPTFLDKMLQIPFRSHIFSSGSFTKTQLF